ncbi:MAG TPA: sel1 repeat family protein, partial [Thauera aminoaromatica]|nr:sel1 repeat family protein [Thauera aminoaromatica]
MRPLVARLLTAWIIAQAPGAAHALEPEEMDALVARPSIGLYKAYAEFKMARYGSAREIWSALAQAGVAEAWFHLGILAEDGLGEPRDAAAALERYRRGGEAGSSKAQYRLGLLHL